jgi:hypothetical protein
MYIEIFMDMDTDTENEWEHRARMWISELCRCEMCIHIFADFGTCLVSLPCTEPKAVLSALKLFIKALSYTLNFVRHTLEL